MKNIKIEGGLKIMITIRNPLIIMEIGVPGK